MRLQSEMFFWIATITSHDLETEASMLVSDGFEVYNGKVAASQEFTILSWSKLMRLYDVQMS